MNMVSSAAKNRIIGLVEEAGEAAFGSRGFAQVLWQQMYEEGTISQVYGNVAAEIVERVEREGEGVLANKATIKHHVAEALIAEMQKQMDLLFGTPLRQWARSNNNN